MKAALLSMMDFDVSLPFFMLVYMWLSFCVKACAGLQASLSLEDRLYKDLFVIQHYNPDVRPVKNASDVVTLTVAAAIQQIIDMNERQQYITTSFWLRLSWTGAHTWDPNDYGGISKIVVPVHKVWKPDLILYNNVNIENRDPVEVVHLMLFSDGTVHWNFPAIFQSSCEIDVSFFPFDEQRCKLKFGSWSYDGSQLDLINSSTSVDITSYIDNGEWKLIGLPVEKNVIYYGCCVAPYPDITFTIVVRRMPHFYLFNLMLPCIIISVINAFNFLLPADSGEKVGFSLTVMLALTVFLLLLAEAIPPASTVIPLIGQYFAATILMTSLSTGMSVFVLHIHYQLPGGKPVPVWLRKLAFVYLAPILCSRRSYGHGKLVPPDILRGNQFGTTIQNNNTTQPQIESLSGVKHKMSWSTSTADDEKPTASNMEQMFTSINENLQYLATRNIEHDNDEDMVTQWKYVAQIFDRLFLLLYIFITILCTVIIMGQPTPRTSTDEFN